MLDQEKEYYEHQYSTTNNFLSISTIYLLHTIFNLDTKVLTTKYSQLLLSQVTKLLIGTKNINLHLIWLSTKYNTIHHRCSE